VSTLERELADVLRRSPLGPKQARAVARRLGWDGRPPATLSAAGATEGYTRERVRQLEQRTRHYVAGLRLPYTEAALGVVRSAAPAARIDVAEELARLSIAEQPFDPGGVVTAAELTGLRAGVLVRDALVLHAGDDGVGHAATVLARKLVGRHGAADVREVARRLYVRPAAARRLLAVHADVTWLNEDWLVLPVRRSRATTGLRKMLAVAHSLTFADTEDGLRRPGCQVSLPRDVLIALCRTLDWVTVEGTTISAAVTLDPDRLLSPLERALVDIFDVHGPVLEFARAVRLGEARGLHSTSVGIYLGKTPVLQTVSRGRYALRGYGAQILPIGVMRRRSAPGSAEAPARTA
jgi:hypothetical protein